MCEGKRVCVKCVWCEMRVDVPALLVAVVRQIGSKDEEKGEDDGDPEMSVEVERDVAFLSPG